MDRKSLTATRPMVPLGKLAQDFVAFGERSHEDGGASLDRFVTCITGCGNAAVNDRVYRIFVAFVCSLAAKSSVEDADGEAVEACRKICDMMGWSPKEGW